MEQVVATPEEQLIAVQQDRDSLNVPDQPTLEEQRRMQAQQLRMLQHASTGRLVSCRHCATAKAEAAAKVTAMAMTEAASTKANTPWISERHWNAIIENSIVVGTLGSILVTVVGVVIAGIAVMEYIKDP